MIKVGLAMVQRQRDKQLVFRTTKEIEEKFKLTLKAKNETMQQIFENCMLEYINSNKDIVSKYITYLQSIGGKDK